MKISVFFFILAMSLQGMASSGFKVEVSSGNAPQVARLLKMIDETKFSTGDFKSRYNQNILGSEIKTYFYSRINKLKEISFSGKACREGALAYVAEVIGDENTMFVCPGFFSEKILDQTKISIMLHEARHIDGHHHTMCMGGVNIGATGGCDGKIEDLGSYAVTAEILAKYLFATSGLNEVVRRELKYSLLETLESFNEQPEGVGNQGVYLIERKSGKAFFYDGQSLTSAPRFPNSRVAVRQDGLVIIPEGNADISMVDPLKVNTPRVEISSQCAKDFNQTPKQNRTEVLEIANDLNFSICVQKNKIWGSIAKVEVEDSYLELPFDVDRVYTSAELGKYNEDAIYIVGKNSRFYRADYQLGVGFNLVALSDNEYQDSWASKFSKIFYFGGELMALSYEGQLMKVSVDQYDTNGMTWVPAAGAEKLRFESVTRPFLWAKDLLD